MALPDSGNLMEMQNLRLHRRSAEAESAFLARCHVIHVHIKYVRILSERYMVMIKCKIYTVKLIDSQCLSYKFKTPAGSDGNGSSYGCLHLCKCVIYFTALEEK